MYNTILIIDDDEITNYLTGEFLDMFGISKFQKAVLNGQEGLEFLKNSKQIPELIMLDINMPYMDGFDFLELFTKTFRGKSKIIMLSSSLLESDIEKSKTFPDVIAFIEKPLTVEKMNKLTEKLAGANSFFEIKDN